MKVLNLYAGIGGNRKLWQDVEVTAVEYEPAPGRTVDENDQPDARLTIQQHKFLLAQAAYNWLCAFCMEELTGTEPDMDWPGFKPGTCELCKRELVIFTTQED